MCSMHIIWLLSDVPQLESNKKTGQSTPPPANGEGGIDSGVRELPSMGVTDHMSLL